MVSRDASQNNARLHELYSTRQTSVDAAEPLRLPESERTFMPMSVRVPAACPLTLVCSPVALILRCAVG
jgi:hypothetical protein